MNKLHHYQLPNGLNIHIKRDHRAPVILSQIWYRIGSSFEPEGITGISHMLEHMMFKGTDDFKVNEIEKLVEAHGGEQNAFTSYDFTCYYQFWHKNHFHKSLEIESSRMHKLSFDEDLFVKERRVVIEERNMRTENNPIGYAYEQFMALCYTRSGRHHPIIGWRQDIEQYRLDELKAWYNQFYSPNNAHLVVIGDIKPDAAYHDIEHYFSNIAATALPLKKQRSEISSTGQRRLTLKHDNAQVPILMMGFLCPSLTSEIDSQDAYALMVLSSILGAASFSRLQKKLQRAYQLASSVHSSYDPFVLNQEIFSLILLPHEGISLDRLEREVLTAIEDIRHGITDLELEMIKMSLKADKVYTLDSLESQGYLIGSLLSIGLDADYYRYLDKIETVTKADIYAVIDKYLHEDNLSILHLLPNQ
ncbi:MAG: M16 family metallopeptidase [Francisellaceae bacterium]